MRIALTGSSGKLGTVVLRELRAAGHDVVGLDVVGTRGPGFVQVDLTDYGQVVDALPGVNDRTRVRRRRAPRGDPGPRHPQRRRDLPQQHLATFDVFWAARAPRHPSHRLRVERDGARAAVRRAAARTSRSTRSTPRDPSRSYSLVKHLEEQLAIELVRWHPDLSITGAAVLERDGAGGLRGVPLVRRRRARAQMEPVGLHRRARRRPGDRAGTRGRPSRLRPVHHRRRRHRDDAAERRARRRGLPRRAAEGRPRRATTPCSRSTRPGACWGSTRSTPGATRSADGSRRRRSGTPGRRSHAAARNGWCR